MNRFAPLYFYHDEDQMDIVCVKRCFNMLGCRTDPEKLDLAKNPLTAVLAKTP